MEKKYASLIFLSLNDKEIRKTYMPGAGINVPTHVPRTESQVPCHKSDVTILPQKLRNCILGY